MPYYAKDAQSGSPVPVMILHDAAGNDVQVVAIGVGADNAVTTNPNFVPTGSADGSHASIGTTTDVEAGADGSLIAIQKRIRTLIAGGLPAALGSSGGLKVQTVQDIALDRSTDTAGVALATDALISGTLGTSNLTAYTPLFSGITASASGATTIVSAVASKKIRVLAWTLLVNGAVNVKWQSHVTPTDKTGLHYFASAGTGISVPFSPVGHFETIAGEALDINLSGAVAVGGSLVYITV